MIKLKCLPPQGNPEFHQLCQCSIDVFKKIGCHAGSYVQLVHGIQSTICCVWPNPDMADGVISFNNMVYHSNLSQCDGFNFDTGKCVDGAKDDLSESTEKLNLNENMIKALKTIDAYVVCIDVIFYDPKKVKAVKNSLKSLKHNCKNILSQIHVMDNYVIDCKNPKFGKLCGISHIIVQSVNALKSVEDCACYRIHGQTEIKVNSVHSKQWFEQIYTVKKNMKRPGGLDSVISLLLELVKLPFECKDKFQQLGTEPPRGVLLSGPPGCGKTSLIRYICHTYKILLKSINGPEVFSARPGETETNLRQIFNEALLLASEGPCILFIDEIDSICSQSSGSGKPQDDRISAQFIKLIDDLGDDDNILVIGATNRPDGIHHDLRRPGRLDREIIIMPPTVKEREDILQSLLATLPVIKDIGVKKLAEMTNGYVGADLACLCQEASYLALSESSKSKTSMIKESHFISAFKNIRPSLQKGTEGVIDLRPVSWCDIGGLEDVKLQIKQAVEWPLKHPEAFERMGLKPPRGVLLYGPPGCCKTTLVRAAATACHCTFLSLSGAQLYSPYVGDSERLISRVFQKARACAPTILFLDELDSIVGKRSEEGGSRGVQERILSTLLNEMDGIGVRLSDGAASMTQMKLLEGHTGDNVKSDSTSVNNRSVLVVAATNRPDLIDDALMRPGRIDKIVYVPPPDFKAREEIFSLYATKFNLSPSNIDHLASKTEYFTGADIEALCREAALQSLTEDIKSDTVTMSHFLQAFKSVTPTLNQDLLIKYSRVNF
ncbi:spermatogenesis-associated protein 5-like protein 1 [Mactra antiquata]